MLVPAILGLDIRKLRFQLVVLLGLFLQLRRILHRLSHNFPKNGSVSEGDWSLAKLVRRRCCLRHYLEKHAAGKVGGKSSWRALDGVPQTTGWGFIDFSRFQQEICRWQRVLHRCGNR